MKVNLSALDTRTYVPITITVSQTDSIPTIVIQPKDKNSSVQEFTVPIHKIKNGMQGEFWLQNKGRFDVIVQSSQGTVVKTITVDDQIFLPFSIEFGVSAALLAIALFGVFLWIKVNKKYAKT